MSNLFKINLQRWQGTSHTSRRLIILSESELAEAVRQMNTDGSATLTLECDDISLILGASNGMYVATAILGFDEIFDMQGSDKSSGVVDFVEGGQSVEQARRNILTLE